LLVLLGAAGILLNQAIYLPMAVRAQEPDEKPKAEKIIEIAVEKNLNGEITSGTVQVRFDDPAELPAGGESVLGVFMAKEDDLITIGTGSIEVEVAVEVVNDEDPVRTVRVSHSGDPVEVKVSVDTVVYADITPRPEISDSDLEAGSKRVTRVLTPGSLEEIEEGMVLRVWGSLADGVVTADVLVYGLID
jgi:hypothetical protein